MLDTLALFICFGGCLAKAQDTSTAPPAITPAAQCSESNGYDTIIAGAGLAGLSAARELQHLDRTVLVLEANGRIGGRGFAGDVKYADHGKVFDVTIDYGGAWIHGVPTNPLTSQVDDMKMTPIRTELNAPYFKDGAWASKEAVEHFEDVVKEYEQAVDAAAASEQTQHALAKYACGAAEKVHEAKLTKAEACEEMKLAMPDNHSVRITCAVPKLADLDWLCDEAKALRPRSDNAGAYTPKNARFADVIPLLVANAGPLESATELDKSSAVDSADFEAGEDDLVKGELGTFVTNLGKGVPVCLNAPVTHIEHKADGSVAVTANSRTYTAKNALVTVSVGVLKRGSITFTPALPKILLKKRWRIWCGLRLIPT